MRYIMTWIGLCAGLALLSGCGNTADGFGRDMERAGRAIQDTF